MASGPTLNIQADKNPNTIKINAAKTMATPRLNMMGLLSLPRQQIGKKSQGWTAYRPILIRQGRTSHQRFIKTEENYNPLPLTDSINTKTEIVNICTVKCLVTGIRSQKNIGRTSEMATIIPTK